jgi:hypothetical protein
MVNNQPTGFKDLLNVMMKRRWFITAIVLGGFMLIMGGIFLAIFKTNEISGEWKELLLLLLGAFIGSYGKIIDYWFSDTDKDKMLVQKMDEEDGVTLSSVSDTQKKPSPQITDSVTTQSPKENVGVEVDEDGDGIMDGLDFDGDGIIDEYFEHRQCEHIWGDEDNNGELECLKCGKIKDPE